ncbi:uncharacterized protein [Dysidea avara]|uniref:uncharacterized protein isoform X1 n=1 Tax=Dysidea avara TaxID=196820 RepID=UPI003316C95C
MAEPMDTSTSSYSESSFTSTCGDEIQLSITRNYAQHWDTWEGVREMVQNWHDGLFSGSENITKEELKFNKKPVPAPMEEEMALESAASCSNFYEVIWESHIKEEPILVGQLYYDPTSECLTMINKNTCLQRRCLLLGFTSKKEEGKDRRANIIGQFGEGMKVGALALLRGERTVCVKTSSDMWSFGLKRHSVLQEEVLTVFVTKRAEESMDFNQDVCKFCELLDGDTCTQIKGIKQEEWIEYSQRFLFLEQANDIVPTDLGSLLLDKELRGQLYSREVWIQNMIKEDLDHGIDINDIKLDRDRNAAMKKSDIEHMASCIWSKAVKLRPGLSSTYFKLLYDGEKSDVKHAPSYVEEKSTANVLADRFFENFGDNAFPVLNTITADKLHVLQQDLRRKVVFCNKNLMDILNRSGRIPDLEDELNFIQQQRKQYISLVDLSEEERMVFHHAMAMVHMVEFDFPEAILDIVESDRMELVYAEARLDLPRWMLSTELVHAKKIPCTSSNCMCAATCLCTGVMQAWQGGRHNSMTRHVMLTSLLAAQASDRAPPYCKEVHENKETARTLADEEYEQMKQRERDLEKNKDEILKELMETKKQNRKELDDLQGRLEDVQQNYTMDEIRFEEKHEDLLGRYQNERESERKEYEDIIHEKDGKHKDLHKKMADIRREHDEVKRVRDKLKKTVDEIGKKRKRELDSNSRQASWFLQRLSSKVTQVNNMIDKKGEAKKNSELQKVLVDLGDKIEQSERKEECILCIKNKRNCALQPCGHKDLCRSCADRLEGTCHQCREKIESILMTYTS